MMLKILFAVLLALTTVQCSPSIIELPENTDDGGTDSNDTSTGESPVGEPPTNPSPAGDEFPADGPSGDESPVDGSPVDELPADESPTGDDTTTSIPTTEDHWTVVYTGYGSVNFDAEDGIVMKPQTPITGSDTHAALVLAKTTEENPVKDFRATIVYSTDEQLRAVSPNPWEVFWIFFNFNFQDPNNMSSGEMTNYFIFKTNGIELGRAFDDETGDDQQAFLHTASIPEIMIGQPYTLTLEKSGPHLDVLINNIPIFSYSGSSLPNALYDVPGMIALYTEDAQVTVYSVEIENWD